MVRYLLLLLAILMPVIILMAPAYTPSPFPYGCYVQTLQVRDDGNNTVVTRGNLRLKANNWDGDGTYTGIIRYFNPNGIKQREVIVSRTLSTHASLKGDYFEIVTTSASKMAGDSLSDNYIEKYASPILVKGNRSLNVLFKTPGGSILSGLEDRPRTKCSSIPTERMPISR